MIIERARGTDDVLNRVNIIGADLLADILIEMRCHQCVMPIEGNFPIRDRQFEIALLSGIGQYDSRPLDEVIGEDRCEPFLILAIDVNSGVRSFEEFAIEEVRNSKSFFLRETTQDRRKLVDRRDLKLPNGRRIGDICSIDRKDRSNCDSLGITRFKSDDCVLVMCKDERPIRPALLITEETPIDAMAFTPCSLLSVVK